jgi:predicted amidohydrolase
VILALASPRVTSSVEEALGKIEQCLSVAAARGAEIVCFPEAYLPGLRGLDFEVPPFTPAQQKESLAVVARLARTYQVVTILGTESFSEAGRHIAAVVVDGSGKVQGCQTKTQPAPSEDPFYVPGRDRHLFEINGVKFGIAICHEGFRYPETVRWAAMRGARIVFHPHATGSDQVGTVPAYWGDPAAPYYEKAMMCRALENAIYFASVNYAFRFQESATCLVGPEGQCLEHLPYGQEGVLVRDIDVSAASGLYASRYAPERYRDARPE